MRYSKVYIESFGYELPPVVVTTSELEGRLAALYKSLHVPVGQVEHMTGIVERRWWNPGYPLSRGAIAAGRKALEHSDVKPQNIGALFYGSVCREYFEPATACRVAAGLGVGGSAAVFDISNACLGAVNGMVEIANRIELGQIRAGMVVACESAREINDVMIERMLEANGMEFFTKSLATLTGGSGAVAVILTDGSFSGGKRRKLIGGALRAAPEYHDLCTWGMEPSHEQPSANSERLFTPLHYTDAASVQKYGVGLGVDTWRDMLENTKWKAHEINKVICHQVGSVHRETILKELGVGLEKDFPTYPFLGNIGTVSLPITAAIAEERGFLLEGDRVGFLGIGSGLNCMMLGVEW